MVDAGATRILKRTDGPPSLVRRRCALEVVEGPDQGLQHEIEGTSLRVGKGPDVELVLSDDAVSAQHFELTVDERGWRLRDLDSTNGTFVLGLRVRDVSLSDGVEIQVGQTRLRFSLHAEDMELPLSRRTNFGRLLGHSPAMRAAFAILERAAKTDTTVLLLGETGTGKELAARGLHDGSARAGGPYVIVDCGAIAKSLIEAHLFGHAIGAYTGATSARAGVFEESDGGTLVLDEIGELPLELQPKLLRAFESRCVTRLGETTPRSFDARFIACTHRNLADEVRRGAFREDLFFRLSVLSVRLPPLRERPDEIPRLVAAFLAELGADVTLSPSELGALSSYLWPGNVRELRNVVERMVALRDLHPSAWLPGGRAAQEAEPSEETFQLAFHDAKQRWNDVFEREYLTRLLERHGANVSEAARVSGLSRQTCYRLMKKHGVE